MTQLTRSLPSPAAVPWSLFVMVAAVKLVVLAVAGREYGYLSDELYFLDAAGHLAAGYVDFPPAIAWITAGWTGLFGSDVLMLRLLACLTGIGITWLAIDITRVLGGGRFAQWLTAIVVVFAPAFLAVQSILTMNVFDHLWWLLAFRLLIAWLESGRTRDVLLLGIVFGCALLTKLSLPFWLIALVAAGLVYRRDVFARRDAWMAGMLMLAVAAPFLAWQVTNDWPFIEFVRAYNASPPEAMVIDQPLFGLVATMNPPFIAVWLPGLVLCLVAQERTTRLIGTAAVICLALMLTAGVKFYFATPLFVIFTAVGALAWERWLGGRQRMAAGFIVGMGVSGLMSIPIAAPVLPPAVLQLAANFIRDGEQGFPAPEPAPVGRYFPHFAEMHGWPELVATVGGVWEAIPLGERREITLFAAYYGQAGALNQLDSTNRLPTAYSGHVAYHAWSRDVVLEDVLFIGFEPAEIESLYGDVRLVARFTCERCMARENGLQIVRARDPKLPRATIHERLKRFYFF